MFLAPCQRKTTVFTRFWASASKNHGIYSVLWPGPRKNTGIYAVSSMLSEAFFGYQRHKNTVNYTIFTRGQYQKNMTNWPKIDQKTTNKDLKKASSNFTIFFSHPEPEKRENPSTLKDLRGGSAAVGSLIGKGGEVIRSFVPLSGDGLCVCASWECLASSCLRLSHQCWDAIWCWCFEFFVKLLISKLMTCCASAWLQQWGSSKQDLGWSRRNPRFSSGRGWQPFVGSCSRGCRRGCASPPRSGGRCCLFAQEEAETGCANARCAGGTASAGTRAGIFSEQGQHDYGGSRDCGRGWTEAYRCEEESAGFPCCERFRIGSREPVEPLDGEVWTSDPEGILRSFRGFSVHRLGEVRGDSGGETTQRTSQWSGFKILGCLPWGWGLQSPSASLQSPAWSWVASRISLMQTIVLFCAAWSWSWGLCSIQWPDMECAVGRLWMAAATRCR